VKGIASVGDIGVVPQATCASARRALLAPTDSAPAAPQSLGGLLPPVGTRNGLAVAQDLLPATLSADTAPPAPAGSTTACPISNNGHGLGLATPWSRPQLDPHRDLRLATAPVRGHRKAGTRDPGTAHSVLQTRRLLITPPRSRPRRWITYLRLDKPAPDGLDFARCAGVRVYLKPSLTAPLPPPEWRPLRSPGSALRQLAA
jgi:hypothetical protein